MTVAGLLLVIATVVVYLVLAFVVHRTYPTWWFDVGVGAGVAMGLTGWVLDRSPWLTGLVVVLGGAWFVLSRRELGLTGPPGLSVAVGDSLPPFHVTTTSGAAFTEHDLAAAGPALLVLYRGWWCPYCTTQLDELHREQQVFTEAGMQVFAVSVDRPEETAALQRRFGETVTFLSDPDGAMLDSVGVRDPDGAAWYDRVVYGVPKGDISLPAVLVVGHDGRICYTYRSPRIDIRANPEDILASVS